MFVRIAGNDQIDPSRIRMRCACGTERVLSENPLCPACGAKEFAAVSVDGAPWKSLAAWRIDALQGALSDESLARIPAEHRDAIRRMLEQNIAELQSSPSEGSP